MITMLPCSNKYYLILNTLLVYHVVKYVVAEDRLYVKALSTGPNNQTKTLKILVNTNLTSWSVEFKYRKPDDSVQSWTIFYKKYIQLFKVINLGEVEVNEPVYRFYCFLRFFDISKVAPLTVIHNFKQRNFEKTQRPNEHQATNAHAFHHTLVAKELRLFGEEVYNACKDADKVFTNAEELRKISDKLNMEDLSPLLKRPATLNMEEYPFCTTARHNWDMSCRCKTHFAVHWYPCTSGLCEKDVNDDEDNILASCGVSSCMFRYQFVFLVRTMKNCLPY